LSPATVCCPLATRPACVAMFPRTYWGFGNCRPRRALKEESDFRNERDVVPAGIRAGPNPPIFFFFSKRWYSATRRRGREFFRVFEFFEFFRVFSKGVGFGQGSVPLRRSTFNIGPKLSLFTRSVDNISCLRCPGRGPAAALAACHDADTNVVESVAHVVESHELPRRLTD